MSEVEDQQEKNNREAKVGNNNKTGEQVAERMIEQNDFLKLQQLIGSIQNKYNVGYEELIKIALKDPSFLSKSSGIHAAYAGKEALVTEQTSQAVDLMTLLTSNASSQPPSSLLSANSQVNY